MHLRMMLQQARYWLQSTRKTQDHIRLPVLPEEEPKKEPEGLHMGLVFMLPWQTWNLIPWKLCQVCVVSCLSPIWQASAL